MRTSHCFGWYYGDGHFIAKVLPFVQSGLTERAQFLVVMEPHIRTLLENTVEANGTAVPPGTFVDLPLQELSRMHKAHGIGGLRNGLRKCLENARMAGFYQIRLLGRVSQELSVTCSTLEEFLQWDKGLHRASRGLPMAALCMYDAALSVDQGMLSHCHDEVIAESDGTAPGSWSLRSKL